MKLNLTVIEPGSGVFAKQNVMVPAETTLGELEATVRTAMTVQTIYSPKTCQKIEILKIEMEARNV